MNSQNAIIVNQLVRNFGKTPALDGFDFEVPEGSVTGLLGPNGAGKSTTIHILLGLLRRHSGSIRVLGFDPEFKDVEIRKQTGFVPGRSERGTPFYRPRSIRFPKSISP